MEQQESTPARLSLSPDVLPDELGARGYCFEGRGPGLGTLLVRGPATVGDGAPLLARPIATLGCGALRQGLERLVEIGADALAPLQLLGDGERLWLLRPWLRQTAADEGGKERSAWAEWLEEEGPEVLEALWAKGFLHGHLVASNLGYAGDGRRWLLDGGIRWVGGARRASLAEERRALALLVGALRGEAAGTAVKSRHPRRALRLGGDARRPELGAGSGACRLPRAWRRAGIAFGVVALVGSGSTALWATVPSPRGDASEHEGSRERLSGSGSTLDVRRRRHGQTAAVANCSLVGVRKEPGPCELRVLPGRRIEAIVGSLVVGEWIVGQPGDVVVLGRWWCGPVPEAGAYDPRSGDVSLFAGWPSASGGQLRAVVLRRSGVLDGRVFLASSGPSGRCQRLVVRPRRPRH